MASITSGEMANCDWLRRNFAGPLFSVIDHGPLRKKQKHFKAIFQSETVKRKKQNHVRKRIRRSEFYYPEDIISGDEAVFNGTDENQKSEAPALQNSQEEIENFVSGQKSANTVKKTRSDINTFELPGLDRKKNSN